MDIRPYLPADREACLSVFDSNTPRSFTARDRSAYEQYLDQPGRIYFVLEHDGAIVVGGGFSVDVPAKLATLQWGIVRSDMQKLGLGRYLLMFRLREIGKLGDIGMVHLETPQLSAPFFEKQGFRLTGASTGPNRVALVKKLLVCA